MKLITISIFFYFFCIPIVLGQHKIFGEIKDETSTPLPYSNIVLYESSNNEAFIGTTSNNEGAYILEEIPTGSYWLEVSILGFETEKTEIFHISETNNEIEINFVIEEQSEMLDDVLIQGKRPNIQQTSEKLIVDIENADIVSSNLQDVLKKVPGVIVTNGNLSYAGQQGITILINGKTTEYMEISSLLRNLPADNIAKIELIQQPGAEFDAEGTGPIINIILKKNVNLGTNGSVKTNLGYDNEIEYGSNFTITNFKNKKNWQLSAGHRKTAWREDLFIIRKIDNEIYDQSTISPYDPRSISFNGALDYYLDEEQTIGLSLSRLQNESERKASNVTEIRGNNSSDILLTENSFDRSRVTYSINPYYQYKNKKNRLDLDLNYVNYSNNNRNNLYQINQSSIEFEDQGFFQDGKYEIITFRSDYKHNFSENVNFLSGAKYAVVETDSELQYFEKNDSNDFEFNGAQSDRFLVDENIFALYSKFTAQLTNWDFSGGLRFEYSDTRGTSESIGLTNKRIISKLLPSASISRAITKNIGLNLSYSYRIDRPSYSSLIFCLLL